MLDNLDRLRADHAEILTLAAEIAHLLAPQAVQEKTPLLQELMAKLIQRTLAHLLLEDRCLYQEMLFSPHDETREIAQQYIVCMGNIAEHMKEYAQAWRSSKRILSSPEKFCEDTRHLLDMLERRINREEQALYPEAETVH